MLASRLMVWQQARCVACDAMASCMLPTSRGKAVATGDLKPLAPMPDNEYSRQVRIQTGCRRCMPSLPMTLCSGMAWQISPDQSIVCSVLDQLLKLPKAVCIDVHYPCLPTDGFKAWRTTRCLASATFVKAPGTVETFSLRFNIHAPCRLSSTSRQAQLVSTGMTRKQWQAA